VNCILKKAVPDLLGFTDVTSNSWNFAGSSACDPLVWPDRGAAAIIHNAVIGNSLLSLANPIAIANPFRTARSFVKLFYVADRDHILPNPLRIQLHPQMLPIRFSLVCESQVGYHNRCQIITLQIQTEDEREVQPRSERYRRLSAEAHAHKDR